MTPVLAHPDEDEASDLRLVRRDEIPQDGQPVHDPSVARPAVWGRRALRAADYLECVGFRTSKRVRDMVETNGPSRLIWS